MLTKASDLEVSLDYHGRLVERVGRGIAQTKKRLYDAELLLNLEPPPDEKQLVKQWTVVVNDVLTKKTQMQFPNLRRMKRQHELQQQLEAETQNLKRASSKQKLIRQESEIMEKQAQNLRNMVLHKEGKFGGSLKGEPLRTIQNYNGSNSIYVGTRTLIRKEGNAFGNANTSLPPWFGPGYYDVASKEEHSETHFQVPFMSPGRTDVPAGVREREACVRRKKQVRDCRSPDHIPNASSSVRSFKEVLSFDDSSLGGEVESDFGIPLPSTLDVDRTDDSRDESILKKSSSVGSYFMDKKSLLSSSKSLRKKNNIPSISMSSNDFNFKTQSKHTLGSGSSSQHQPPARINPVHTHHEYALKILATEEKQSSKWQVPDFTKGALACQPPVAYDEYRIEDTFVEDDAKSQETNHISKAILESEKALKAGSKYNADIFFMKPLEYHPPNTFSPNFKSTNTSGVVSPGLNSRVASPPQLGSLSRPESRQPLKKSLKNEDDPSSSITSSNHLHLEQLSREQSVHSVVESWCNTNGVINTRTRKGRKKHDDFLDKHPKLPSIELSLSGLLLDENPYTEKDDIIKKNPGFNIDAIKL